MTSSGARVALASLAVVLALGAAPAYAGYPDTVKGAHADCGAGNYPLKGHYTVAVLVRALATLSTSDAQYSTCKDALEAAIRAAEQKAHRPGPPKTTTTATTTTTTTTTSSTGRTGRTGGGPGGPSGGSTGLTGEIASQQISAAVTNGSQPQTLDGHLYTPGAITTRSSSFISSIPTPILAVLAALIA